jgi:IMP cyclohydrolase
MDVPVIEITPPSVCEVLRDHSTIIGIVEPQALTGKAVARDARGVLVGTYDPRLNETRDARGRVIGRGNLLGALLLRGR